MSRTTPDAAPRGRLPRARRDRRPALAALALLLILGGALGSALLAYRSGQRVDVLVARRDIPIGTRVSQDDLGVARVATDARGVVSAASRPLYVGSYATTSVPKDAVLSSMMFSSKGVVPRGGQLVGVVLDATRRPTTAPKAGDVVRLYYVSGQDNQAQGDYSPGQAVVDAALVTQAGRGKGADSTSLTVLVEDAKAGDVAQLSAAGGIAVATLPPGTRPALDLGR